MNTELYVIVAHQRDRYRYLVADYRQEYRFVYMLITFHQQASFSIVRTLAFRFP